MKIGIMQPYFLPYIAYFSLINLVDKFIYYDDVQYIKRGWVNRNRIKIGDEWKYITLPIKKAPLSNKINEIFIVDNERETNKIKKSIELNYRKAPFFKEIFDLLFNHLTPNANLSDLNIKLELNFIINFYDSSVSINIIITY
ncbi:MAG: WbqC family protein [Promethearchaeota archaeon]